MNVALQQDRDHAYNRARGAKNVLTAADEGADATAVMAYKARAEQEANLADSENKISSLKIQIAGVAGTDNKEHAKLQLKLERAKKNHAQMLATANTMAQAVDKMIAKAGEIVGRARADYAMKQDPTTSLEDAIVAADRAKMQLKAHDQEVENDNKLADTDKKNKALFSKANEGAAEGVDAVKERQAELNHKANQQDFEAAKQAAAQTAGQINNGLVVVPEEAMQPADIQRMAAESNALAAQAAVVQPVAAAPAAPAPAAKEAAKPEAAKPEAKKEGAKEAAKEGGKEAAKPEAKEAAKPEAKEAAKAAQ